MNHPEITPDPDVEAVAMSEDALPIDPAAAQPAHPSPFLDIISGQFDAEDVGGLEEPATKRVLAPQATIKLARTRRSRG
jgi:hypothetical protein